MALDFYYDDQDFFIYWTDVVDDKIYKGKLLGEESITEIETIVENGLGTAEGLAIDWIGQNIYWVESKLDQIEVAKLDGKYRRTLISDDIQSPRAIALDPHEGKNSRKYQKFLKIREIRKYREIMKKFKKIP